MDPSQSQRSSGYPYSWYPSAASAAAVCSPDSSAISTPSLLPQPLPPEPALNTPCFASIRRPITDEESAFRTALQQAHASSSSIHEHVVRCVQEITTRKPEFLSCRKARQKEVVDLASRLSTLCQRILRLREQVPLRTQPESVLSSFNEIQDLEIKSHFMRHTLSWLQEVYNSVEFKEAFEEYIKAITRCKPENHNLKEHRKAALEMIDHHKKVTKNFDPDLKSRLDTLHDDIIGLYNHRLRKPQQSIDDLASQIDALTLSESSLPASYGFSDSQWFSWNTSFHKTCVKIQEEVAKQLNNLHATLDSCIKMCCTGKGELTLTSDLIQQYESACEHFAKKLTVLRYELIAIEPTPQLPEGLAYTAKLQELISEIRLQIKLLKCFDIDQFQSVSGLVKSLSAFLTSKSESEKLACLASLAKQFTSITDSTKHPLIERTHVTVRQVLTSHGSLLVRPSTSDEEIRRDIVAGNKLAESNGELATRIKLYLMRHALKCLYYSEEHSDPNFNLALLSLGKKSRKTSDAQFSLVIDQYREFNEFNNRIDILELFPTIFRLLDLLEVPVDITNIQQIHNFLKVNQLLADVQAYILQTQAEYASHEQLIHNLTFQIDQFNTQIPPAKSAEMREQERLHHLDLQIISNNNEILQLEGQLREVKLERQITQHALAELNMKQERINASRREYQKFDALNRLARQDNMSGFTDELKAAKRELDALGTEADFRCLEKNISDLENRTKDIDASILFIEGQISRKTLDSQKITSEDMPKHDKSIRDVENQIKKLQAEIDKLIIEKNNLLKAQPSVSRLISQLNTLACERFSRLEHMITQDYALITALSQALYSKNSDTQATGLASIATAFDTQNFVLNTTNAYLMTALQLHAVMQFCIRENLPIALREKSERVSLLEEKALVVALHHYVTDEQWRSLLTELYSYPILELVLYRLTSHPGCIRNAGRLNGTQDPLNELRSSRSSTWFELMQRISSRPLTSDSLQQLDQDLERLQPPLQADIAQ